MKIIALLLFASIIAIIEWQERRQQLREDFNRAKKKTERSPQLSLFEEESPMFADQIHPLCEN